MKSVSGRKFCKVLEAHGWSLDRINGSHHVYKKEGSFALPTVPVHGNTDLKPGLLASLLKQAGLTEDDLK